MIASTSPKRLLAFIDHKWRMLSRIWQSDGFIAVVWELTCQALKPVLRAYTAGTWLRHRRLGRSVVSINGCRMTLLTKDKGVSVELAVHKSHEPRASQLLSDFLVPGMSVIDIGSNIGYFALLESRCIQPNGRLLAIEPVPENASLCRNNLSMNGYPFEFRQVAISDHNGTLPLYLSARSNWHSLLPSPQTGKEILVPVRKLDTLVDNLSLTAVHLVRMDLEGYETVVLNGMHNTLRKYSPRLLIELHPAITGPDAMIRFLRELEEIGYAPEWVIDQERDGPWRWRFLSPERPTMCELLSDWRINIYPRCLTALFKKSSRYIATSQSADHEQKEICASA